MPLTCRICRTLGEFPLCSVPERMFATGERFDYFRCMACGCVQIVTMPEDLSRFYPPEAYYSYHQGKSGGWRGSLRRARNLALLQGRVSPLAWIQPYEALAAVARLAPHRASRILDVGCGQGQLVEALREQGFRHVMGIDPFLGQDLAPWIKRCDLAGMDGTWDLIMLHHSLEHLPDPQAAMAEIVRLLAPRGRVLIRVPTIDSWAFAHYGDCWVQWDAPRHLTLFSRKSLARLGEAHGLKQNSLWDDSTALQFWGSQAYRRGLPLAAVPRADRFKPWYSWRAARLNARGQGDQLVCILGRQTQG